jgi:hypothetical protein
MNSLEELIKDRDILPSVNGSLTKLYWSKYDSWVVVTWHDGIVRRILSTDNLELACEAFVKNELGIE